MAGLFLSYRRDDSAGFAGRLADALEAEFGPGSVFRDVDDICPGEDFVQAIDSQLHDVGAVLVMIGPHWLAAAAGGSGRRLDDPKDFVRQEIEAALASGKPVIPLLVGGAVMPAEAELPAAIAGLGRRQAVVLTDSGWRAGVERLVQSLRPLLPGQTRGSEAQRSWRRWRPLLPGLVAALMGLLAMAWWHQAGRQADVDEPPSAAAPPRVEADYRPGTETPLHPQPPAPVVEPRAPGAATSGARPVKPAPTLATGPTVQPTVAPAPAVAAPAGPGIEGRWQASVRYDWGASYDETFEFRLRAGQLRGSAGFLGRPRVIEEGRLEGRFLSFITHYDEVIGDEPPRRVTHQYEGEVDADGIRFTLQTSGGYSLHPTLAFSARRVPDSRD